MSSTTTTALSAGAQQLYNHGLLPSSLPNSVLNSSSSSELSKLADSSVALQETAALFGFSSNVDSADLSSTASNALLQEINPTSSSTSSATDPLTQAVNNELTSSLNAAVSKYLPQGGTTSGSQINLLA
jgi:hypothetical protein